MAAGFLSAMEDLPDRFADAENALASLEAYYTSSQWQKDYSADEKGCIPQDLKRGVLSEDGISDVLDQNDRLKEQLKQITEKYCQK